MSKTTGIDAVIVDLCSDEDDIKPISALPTNCIVERGQVNSVARTSRKRKHRPDFGNPVATCIDQEAKQSDGTAVKQPKSILIFLDGEGTDSGMLTDGLMSSLRTIPNVTTCAGQSGTQSMMPHIQQIDKWSCGYRNLQMLLGSILPVLPGTHSYFCRGNSQQTVDDGYLCLPSLVQLQTMLEQSWADGFDSKGADHFQNSIVGSPSQIGAVEVSSCLAFSGIDSVVIQFIRCPESRSQLASFCAAYFTKRHSSPCPFCKHHPPISSRDIASQLLEARPSVPHTPRSSIIACECPSLPLYLQWKGHSVSVIGVEAHDGSFYQVKHLLVFDPNVSGDILKKALGRRDIKPFRLAVSKLERRDCQIVLPSTRSLSSEERTRRKLQVHALTAAYDAVQQATLSKLPPSRQQYRRRFH